MGSTLYTGVSQSGKKDIIILNSKYSRKELAEKLKAEGDFEDRIDTIVKEGIYLQKELRIKIHSSGFLTTHYGVQWYLYKGDKVILDTEGGFTIKRGILTRLFG